MAAPTNRPKAPPEAPQRLHKLLAAAGLGSRREIEAWIIAGRVAINGRVARIGEQATRIDRITVDGNAVAFSEARSLPRVLLYHKPEGELVTRRDAGGRATVFERLPALAGARWIAVGRLDLNSCGLLLVTDSGELANRLMHPRYGIRREYAVRVLGELAPAEMRRLLDGVELDDGAARFELIEPMPADKGSANRWYRVELSEGRNREVRRMFEVLGRKVSRLVRVRYGPVTLPRDLRPGHWRELAAREVGQLAEAPQRPRRLSGV